MGVPIVLMDGWDAEETLALIDKHRVTHTHMVPTMFHRLLSLPDDVATRYDMSSLIYVIHGAAPCPVDVKRRLIEWLGPIVTEYYAATEGSGTSVGVARMAGEARHRRQGRTRPTTSASSTTRAARSRAGTIGTVFLKAPAASRFEYFKAPEKTSGAYRGDYFTLGDVGYVDDDGYLFLTDRSAHLIISGGVNIYPAEVEAVLLGHPAVGDAGVVGVPDDEWGEIVVAAVELHAGLHAVARARRGARRVVPRPHRALQVSPPRRVRRGASPARQRQALQAPAARTTPLPSGRATREG